MHCNDLNDILLIFFLVHNSNAYLENLLQKWQKVNKAIAILLLNQNYAYEFMEKYMNYIKSMTTTVWKIKALKITKIVNFIKHSIW